MKGIVARGMALLGLCCSLLAQAAPEAWVDAVQSPAWVLRAGKQLPLTAGMPLQNRDKVVTGGDARVVLMFADGSAFKLGEHAQVTLNALNRDDGGRFSGGLDVTSGGGRLVVHEFEEAPVRRAINVRFGQVTALVRGEADLTGHAEAAADRVALRDGAAVMSHPQMQATELSYPLQVFEAPRERPVAQVKTISRGEGALWALETQPRHEAGTQVPSGRWALLFGPFDKAAVLALHDRLSRAGFSTRIKPLPRAGGYVYELRLMNLVTEREAETLARRLSEELELPAGRAIKS